jgi:hypothetical protein
MEIMGFVDFVSVIQGFAKFGWMTYTSISMDLGSENGQIIIFLVK